MYVFWFLQPKPFLNVKVGSEILSIMPDLSLLEERLWNCKLFNNFHITSPKSWHLLRKILVYQEDCESVIYCSIGFGFPIFLSLYAFKLLTRALLGLVNGPFPIDYTKAFSQMSTTNLFFPCLCQSSFFSQCLLVYSVMFLF